MRYTKLLIPWLVLAIFLAWDWAYSQPVDLRHEPPAIAISSGQAPVGAHCSSTF